MALQFENFFDTTLSAPIGATDTVIPLTVAPSIATEGWLCVDYDIPSKREFIYYTSKATGSVTLASVGAGRGQDNTSAIAHLKNAKVRMNINAGMLQSIYNQVFTNLFADIYHNVTGATGGIITPDTTGSLYNITALGADATFGVPSGSPVEGQGLALRIKDNGTIRNLSWNAIYRPIGITLPSATAVGKTYYVTMRYNAVDTKWDVLGVARQN